MASRVIALRPRVPAHVDAFLAAAGPSDVELVARARRGDRDAEEALYRRHSALVGGMAARLLGSVSDAEDVVQETFCVAFDRLAQLRDPSVFRAWVCQIAVSRVKRHFRARRWLRLVGLAPDDAGLSGLVAPGVDGELRAELALVDSALSRVPTEERLAWVLHHVEGAKLEEAACFLDCSLATVKRRIAAAQAAVDRHRGDDR